MSLLSRCPELVTQLIGWYQWKAKISALNSEYLTNMTYYDGEGSLLWVNFHTFQFRKTYDTGTTFNFYIKRVYRRIQPFREHIVAILPSKYYFTSGSHNPNGFLSIKSSKHNWMPDFYSQW